MWETSFSITVTEGSACFAVTFFFLRFFRRRFSRFAVWSHLDYLIDTRYSIDRFAGYGMFWSEPLGRVQSAQWNYRPLRIPAIDFIFFRLSFILYFLFISHFALIDRVYFQKRHRIIISLVIEYVKVNHIGRRAQSLLPLRASSLSPCGTYHAGKLFSVFYIFPN